MTGAILDQRSQYFITSLPVVGYSALCALDIGRLLTQLAYQLHAFRRS